MYNFKMVDQNSIVNNISPAEKQQLLLGLVNLR